MDPMQDTDMPDLDTIKAGLMKVIDQMNQMESQRLLPDGHPQKEVAPVAPDSTADVPSEGAIGADEPDASVDGDDVDPNILSSLMDKASSVDNTGASPEDNAETDLPPEIMAAVADKKKKPLV